MEKLFLILSVILILSHPASALPPSRSAVCAGLLSATAQLDPLALSDKVYALNSAKVLRSQIERETKKEVFADIPAGLFDSEHSPKKSAARLKGIELFSANSESAELNSENKTWVMTVAGRENIKNFVEAYGAVVTEVDQKVSRSLFEKYKKSLLVTLGALLITNKDVIAQKPFAAFGLFIGMTLYFKHDFLLSRPFFWNYRFQKALNKFADFADGSGSGRWVHWAENTAMNSRIFETMSEPNFAKYTEDMISQVEAQNILESISLQDRLLISSFPKIQRQILKTRQWVGMDWVATRDGQGQPELQIFLRSSRERPIFPKGSSEKSEERELSPVFDGVLQPVPVTVPGGSNQNR